MWACMRMRERGRNELWGLVGVWGLTVQLDGGRVQGVLGDGHQHTVVLVAEDGIQAHAHRDRGAIGEEDVLMMKEEEGR
jgi:hypothetical protein